MKFKIFYLYTFKGLINRLKFFKLKSIASIIFGCFAIIFPVFIFNKGFNLEIPKQYLQMFFSLYFSYIFLKVFFAKDDYSKISENYLSVLRFVPGNSNLLYRVLQYDNIVRNWVSYGLIYIIFFYYSKTLELSLLHINLILVFSVAVIPVLWSSINSMISVKLANKYIRTLFFVISVFFALNVVLIYLYNPDVKILAFLPNYIMADVIQFILGSNHTKEMLGWVGFRLVLLLAITVAIHIFVRKSITLYGYDIYERSKVISSPISGKRFKRARNMLFFLSGKLKLLIAKELVQIWDEKGPLVSALIQTTAASVVMIVSSKIVDKGALIIGFIVAICYISFLMSLFSIPRESRTKWILKSIFNDLKIVTISKIIACYIASLIGSLAVYIFYSLLSSVTLGVTPLIFISPFIWCIFTAIPASVGLGFIFSSFMPYEIMDKKKKISYKFNGLEGIILMVLVFLVAVPVTLVGGFLKDFGIFYIKVILILYVGLIIWLANWAARKKLMQNS